MAGIQASYRQRIHDRARALLPWVDRLPSGWVGFSLRTWCALVLGLTTAFWLQLDNPLLVGVTVMILAQPLRGQALSKAFYRLLGTLVGMGVSIVLVAVWNQQRGPFLGGVALWLAACAFVGSLERDFRSYAALLSGYTVALVAVNCIDTPQNVFNIAISRASAITLGVFSVAVINILSGSPEAWRGLADGLKQLTRPISETARAALQHGYDRGAQADIRLGARVLALTTRLSYARTELERGGMRANGARLAMTCMLSVLDCAHGLGRHTSHDSIAPVVADAIACIARRTDLRTDQAGFTLHILDAIRATQPGHVPSHEEAFAIERAACMLSARTQLHVGQDMLAEGTGAAEHGTTVNIAIQPNYVLAFIGALRVLIGFSFAAGVCVVTGLPGATVALAQTALTLTLAATNVDTARFGMGAVIGMPCSVLAAGMLNFFVLLHGADMPFLALTLLPQTFIACLLLMRPSTAAIGFNYGVFFFAILGLDNHQSYNPTEFLNRNIFYLLAALLAFITLVLLFPPSARRQRFWMGATIVRALERQMAGRGQTDGPTRLTRAYDRLAQMQFWTDRLPAAACHARQMESFATFTELEGALARARLYARQAQKSPLLRPAAERAQRALVLRAPWDVIAPLQQAMAAVPAPTAHLPPQTQVAAVNLLAGLNAVLRAWQVAEAPLRHYGIIQRRKAT
ncbi:FUSC family protein [Komagataeibacter medellinensis]|uniref:FUSC family protein n=1 Tax=Komagataeibacter medellinensis TaxID=1177712 RepID=A0ABQ6VVT3_9PROT|nr:FUSC family protein [Komagataeibacter medellinensis]KAB8124314.1 FUSC family protein [Komagataeibacter medellinensis]